VKRKILVIVLGLLLFASTAFAAGTLTQSYKVFGDVTVVTLAWAAGGSGVFTSTAFSSTIMAQILGKWLYIAETYPGASSAAPTDQYDITITNSSGLDVVGGVLADRATATNERRVVKLDSTSTISGGAYITDTLTLNIANNSNASATGTIKLFFGK
jgi:hypothetical protein